MFLPYFEKIFSEFRVKLLKIRGKIRENLYETENVKEITEFFFNSEKIIKMLIKLTFFAYFVDGLRKITEIFSLFAHSQFTKDSIRNAVVAN